MRSIAVLGGAGYIGSHLVLEALRRGWNVLVVDSYKNVPRGTFDDDVLFGLFRRQQKLVEVNDIDICNEVHLHSALSVWGSGARSIDAIVLLASSIDVAESITHPCDYYDNNLRALLSTLKCMQSLGLKNIVFSSTAAVYGAGDHALSSGGLDETARLNPASPYGRSKEMCERILADCCSSLPLAAMVFRFFNACGADKSGRLGLRKTTPTHLLPQCLSRVLQWKRGELVSPLCINGTSYQTPDGTAIRDFVHVSDIADAMLRAVEYLVEQPVHRSVHEVINLGTGVGSSVRQIVDTVRRVTGCGERGLPSVDGPRRPGDVAAAVANPAKARSVLGWTARNDLESIVTDEWCYYLQQQQQQQQKR